ncbi:3-hydroxybutyryl-CoA dehydrogenase [Pontibacter sp. BT310]|uniref:3-hydroxybutyryl-CoA dehydrogenase n=1 Tax=Pontibacter populi TaxID=890055 RepID=A0ABS6X9B4_9BACT|nr:MULTISPECIES: 3-hydroxyacyl-CoA dehydrogenase NAD-binding domain-containing protein [Pontibacter]MBJ6117401.1 3-hydroxybutyryl-CoA dehydrogenase [Pontibacter sp. BT310]MBR0569826.1 3-hydroxybutyryl-CoA dehydrogenase [Microvirga sp. STS03]MBW3364254.1 3-hydroxybutyryl-CoA dehydrogenase [Pontibacter populi]
MKFEDIQTIGIVGAGTMGQGIAQICAQAGYKTILFDINATVLDKAQQTTTINLDKGIERGKLTQADKEATLANLTFTGNTLDLHCDVIIEAVVERLEVKQSIFKELADINSDQTILASNTSSIPITRIAAGVPNPERVVGMHFFNPAHIMKLVEVISGAATSPEVAHTIKKLAQKLEKTPVMAQDSPGFIVNRVARHYYVEGLKLLEEGIADVETIDKLMQASGFKMGPFELMDLIGVDTNFSVTTSMFEAFHYDPKFRPSRIQQQKVDAGHHGRKSGKGFYDYK